MTAPITNATRERVESPSRMLSPERAYTVPYLALGSAAQTQSGHGDHQKGIAMHDPPAGLTQHVH